MTPADQLDFKEDRYQLALEAAGLGIIDNNLEEGNVWWAPYCYDLFGLPRNTPITLQTLLTRIHPDDRERVQTKLQASMDPTQRAPYDNQYRVVNDDGSVRAWVKARGKVYFEGERPVRLIVTVQDISGEIATREQHQKLLTLVENGIELMSILEKDGKNSYINKAGLEMLGFDSFDQVLDTPIERLHEPEDIAFVQANVLPSVMTKGRWSGTMNVRHLKTGEVFPVHNNTIRIDDPLTGEMLCIGAVMRDIRPEIEVQRALAESKRDLERRVAERTSELERKNSELEEYTYITSHDLQEPLRKIKLFAEMIREKDHDRLSDYSKEKFAKLTDTVERMGKALKDLLRFSALSYDDLAAPVDLNETLREVCIDLELMISQGGADLQVAPLPVIEAVPHQMHQLFYNLVANALKFGRPGVPPQITIGTGRGPSGQEGDGLFWIHVQDNGIGFSAENSEKIFVLFQRLHARHEYPGSGIGLALCRKVAQHHGGQIVAESRPGEGATFYIGLPAARMQLTVDK